MKQDNLPGCTRTVTWILIMLVPIVFLTCVLSCTPKAHSVKIENYTVSIDTCPVFQKVKHPRKHSKWLHPANCNRAKKWEAPGIMAKPKKR